MRKVTKHLEKDELLVASSRLIYWLTTIQIPNSGAGWHNGYNLEEALQVLNSAISLVGQAISKSDNSK